jgi:hypothetical protein
LVRWSLIVCVVLVRGNALAGTSGSTFDENFTSGSLRVDVVHFGTRSDEGIVFRRAVHESIWGGPTDPISPRFRAGEYTLRVRDLASGALIFERGFSTLFGEWRTTEEAVTRRRAFEETYEIPFPKRPVELTVSAWTDSGGARPIVVIPIDPGEAAGQSGRGGPGREIIDLIVNGEPAHRVDLVILGDGYSRGEREKFLGDCRHVVGDFFDVEPLRSMRDRFNVHAVFVASAESGVDEPSKGIFRDTPFGLSFDTFDSERYCMTEEVWALHDALSDVPHDAIFIVGNSSRYGGGAIYNLYTAFSSDNEYGDYLCVHEFGHGFAGLADEYYMSQVSYNDYYPPGREPWEPNITALLDPGRLKWGDLLEPGAPIPTPSADARYRDAVGAFEGAGYAAKGLYRPSVDCKMFSKGNKRFCKVCERAIIEAIRFYSTE